MKIVNVVGARPNLVKIAPTASGPARYLVPGTSVEL